MLTPEGIINLMIIFDELETINSLVNIQSRIVSHDG
jgi:hypothetical protein